MRISAPRVTRLVQSGIARCRDEVLKEFRNEPLVPNEGESLAWDVLLAALGKEISQWTATSEAESRHE